MDVEDPGVAGDRSLTTRPADIPQPPAVGNPLLGIKVGAGSGNLNIGTDGIST